MPTSTDSPESVVVLTETEAVVVIEDRTTLVEVTAPGPQGGKGDKGDTGVGEKGDTGDTGSQGVPGAGFNYLHSQSIPNTVWVINHNLNGFPNVSTVDTNSPPETIEGVVKYVDANTIRVEFAVSVGGTAYLS